MSTSPDWQDKILDELQPLQIPQANGFAPSHGEPTPLVRRVPPPAPYQLAALGPVLAPASSAWVTSVAGSTGGLLTVRPVSRTSGS